MTANFLGDLTLLAAIADDLLSPVLFMQRNIGGFIADVTLEEEHTDELRITGNPVERGAAITDHSFKEPAVVVITCGWSNSSPNALINPFYVQMVYDQMLNLQSSREPFSITTGKRVYDNMLIARISVKTDEKSENALLMTMECREVILVSTQTVTTPDAKNMNDPAANGGTTDRGSVSTTPVPGGTLSSGSGTGDSSPARVIISGGTVDHSIVVPKS